LLRHPAPFRSRVAVLDDDIKFIRMVERVLNSQEMGICPVTTVDLDEAVRVIGESDCQVALVDIFMYGSAAGFDVIERLRSNPATAEMPLIVTSAARREVAKHLQFLRQHHCDVLFKPFDCDELIEHVTAPVRVPKPQPGVPLVPASISARAGVPAA
jgi:DNA-binding response OmpR family regulator